MPVALIVAIIVAVIIVLVAIVWNSFSYQLKAEHAFLQNQELRELIERNRAHPERRRPRPTPPKPQGQ